MRILQLVHGFPPFEAAGTEQYASRMAAALGQRGAVVHTLAATIAPARAMYSCIRSQGLTRLVNNLPLRAVRNGGVEPAIDAIYARVEAEFRPDVVLIQHLAGLSLSLPISCPSVWFLHDAWAWCPSGGQLICAGAPCDGPSSACVPCASSAMTDSARVDAALRVGSTLGTWVSPSALHRAWKRLPSGVRGRLTGGAAEPVLAAALAKRAERVKALAQRSLLLAPSRYYAELAEAQGLGAVGVVPHGVDPEVEWTGGEDFVFMGTLAWHKGPDLVREAWIRAGRPGGLRMYGAAHASFSVPNDGHLPAEAVQPTLAKARALVLGSRWPENAPLVVSEARAVGCPVIAPDIGGLAELVTPEVGVLYPAGDVDALAQCLRAFKGFRAGAGTTVAEHVARVWAVLQRAVG